MTSRERTLLAVVLGLLAVLGVGVLANSTIIQPLSNLNQQINVEETKQNGLQRDIKAEQDYVKRVQQLSPRLAQWKKLSLPEGDRKPEAFKTHLSNLSVKYQQKLSRLLSDRKFQNQTVSPGVFAPGPRFDERTKKPIYSSLPITLKGETDLANIVQLFVDLSKMPLLQQVKSFSITSQRTSRNLAVQMTVEVLLVTDADTIDKRKEQNDKNSGKAPAPPAARAQGNRPPAAQARGKAPRQDASAKYDNILPTFSGKGKDKPPVVLAPPPHNRNYADIAKKNIFTPLRSTSPGSGPDDVEPPSVVLPYVKLTHIAKSDYYGCLIARMHNMGNKDDNALLIAGPLPTKSRYQVEKKELARQRQRARSAEEEPKERLLEPARSWIVKDRSKTPLLEVTLLRIDEWPPRVIMQIEDLIDKEQPKKLYAVRIGDDLKEVMDKPALDKEAIRKLGLASDPKEVFKKVKLVKLRFHQDRRDKKGAYEGTFDNPEKGEKPTLATETLPEELDTPDEWLVRDHFDSELLRIKVIRVEKDRLIFFANGKHYAIKLNESLHDALARPLSDAEVKAILSKTP
jgi:hypothetical protein